MILLMMHEWSTIYIIYDSFCIAYSLCISKHMLIEDVNKMCADVSEKPD